MLKRCKDSTFPYFCYGIILQDNHIESQLVPALIVCWDVRAHDNSQVFTLHRRNNISNPVITTTREDVYELSALYKRFRFSIRDENGQPRKTYVNGILVSCNCNIDASIICGPYYYISHVNDEPGPQGVNLQRWQDAYLEKERLSHIYDLADVLSSEDGVEISQDYKFPFIDWRSK